MRGDWVLKIYMHVLLLYLQSKGGDLFNNLIPLLRVCSKLVTSLTSDFMQAPVKTTLRVVGEAWRKLELSFDGDPDGG